MNLSVKGLKNHILVNHPIREGQKVCDNSVRVEDFLKLDNQSKIPEVLRELGLGPSMYLLFLKGLRNLFFILTLINIPIMYIYASGTGTSVLDMGTEKIFGTFNIGNLG